MFQQLVQQFRDSVGELPLRSKVSMTFLIIGVLTAFIFIIAWLNQPDYQVLFSGLSPNDAGRIVEYLQDQNVKYKYDHGGSTVMVPSQRVYDMRMQLANEGIPNDGVVGYEIFDENNFGMTEYVQQVNYKRALEGELQRTIQQMNEVKAARVHLVLPKESLFKEDQSDPTAAVIVKLSGHTTLEHREIEGIRYLVANSVEKLDAQAVTILDASGKLLTDEQGTAGAGTQATSQYTNQQKLEDYLTTKAQSMLNGVLGYGKSIVRVTADLNFEQIQKTEELYNPESQVIRSEERIQSSQMARDTSSNQQEHIITNYEMNKTVQNVVSEVGEIKRLHVAVLIDGSYQKSPDSESEGQVYQPRTPQEMQRLERIVKAAVGFDITRGDKFEISNIQFDLSEYEEQEMQLADQQKRQFYQDILNKVLSVGLIVFFLILLRNVLKRSKVVIGEMPFNGSSRSESFSFGGGTPKGARRKQHPGDYEIEMSEEVLEKTQLQEAIKHYSEENPQQVTSLIRSWIVEN